MLKVVEHKVNRSGLMKVEVAPHHIAGCWQIYNSMIPVSLVIYPHSFNNDSFNCVGILMQTDIVMLQQTSQHMLLPEQILWYQL